MTWTKEPPTEPGWYPVGVKARVSINNLSVSITAVTMINYFYKSSTKELACELPRSFEGMDVSFECWFEPYDLPELEG